MNKLEILKKPQIGLGVFTINHTKDRILLGKRKNDFKFGLPGGKLEYLETFEQGISRELQEETNITINDLTRFKLFCYLNLVDIDYHWVNFDYYVLLNKPEEMMVKNNEIDKFESWDWVDLNFLFSNKEELFYPLRRLIEITKVNTIEEIINYSKKI
jgi:ADP-ribose pyrophosphatase YjhB (NUDIX family)